jgi:hypothetical protein
LGAGGFMSKQAREIGRTFLCDIDKFLKKNIHTMSCNDMHDIYSGFFEDLKEYKGNSNNFTGLSEYLVLRSIIHSLNAACGEFYRKVAARGTGADFMPVAGDNIRIGNSMRIDIGNKRYYPDIGVKYNDKLVAAVQIKVYLTNGSKEIDSEVTKINALRSMNNEMKATLIIFGGPSKEGRQYARLENLKKDNIGSLILKGEAKTLQGELLRTLPDSITNKGSAQPVAQRDAEDGAR